jgi:hypothetical protein
MLVWSPQPKFKFEEDLMSGSEEGLSQTKAMGRVGGSVSQAMWPVAQAMWWGNYSDNNATSWPILQAETFQIFS